ncbi:MAG: hypothetical protein L6305_06840 [Actinomycetia bacterium]|nr:hypothetical protein [Actinomycetes bacterium]
MRNKFFKKIFVSLVLIMVVGLLSAGCGGGGTTTPPITPVVPTTCTVIVTSQSNLVWGQAVYMDGMQQPLSILAPWGSVQITNVSVGVYHNFCIIQGNTFSHMEFLTTLPGTNYVHFSTF